MDLAGNTWIESLHLAGKKGGKELESIPYALLTRRQDIIKAERKASRRRIGFLDLATEIRIQIYKYLLINQPSSGGELEVVHIVDSLQRRQNDYTPYLRYSSGNGKGLVSPRGARNSARYIHGAILQTCRKIADEGSYFMYSNNVFSINLSRESFAPGYRYFHETDQHLNQPIANLFSSKKKSQPFLSGLSYVAFFQQIGARNTATIAHLQILGNNAMEYEMTMPVLTEVLKTHMPQLETTIFYLMADPDNQGPYDWKEAESCTTSTSPVLEPGKDFCSRNSSEAAFDPEDPRRAAGPFRPLYAALDDFSKKLVDLESLEFRGHWHSMQQGCLGFDLDCGEAMMATDRIAAQVRQRSRQQREELGLVSDKDVEQPQAVNRWLLR